MNQINLVLDILLVLSIVCSLTVITSTNPVIAIIYLIGVFINAALYLIFAGLGFIGISYIIVYIGAITVLFLFIVMMINIDIIDIIEIGPEYGKNLPLAYTISILFLSFFMLFIPLFTENFYSFDLFLYINKLIYYPLGLSTENIVNYESILNSNLNILNPETSLTNLLQIEILGESLYSFFGVPLIFSSLVLLLALVSPIILSRNNTIKN